MTEEKKKKITDAACEVVEIVKEVASKENIPYEFALEAVKTVVLKQAIKDVCEHVGEGAETIKGALSWLR